MSNARLLISSRNYSSWSLRGWLMTRLAGLPVVVEPVSADDPNVRAELLNQSSSILLPCLIHGEVTIWDVLAIAEYLNEEFPAAGMLPAEKVARARCRAVSGEMHQGFTALRSSLPMNLRSFRKGFVVWSGAQADIERIATIWRECLGQWGGPYLFGDRMSIADAMYAPVVTRFATYDVKLDAVCAGYCRTISAWPELQRWIAEAKREPEEVVELEVEF